MMQLEEQQKEKERFMNILSRQQILEDNKSIKPYSEHSNLNFFKSPLRSSGIHNKVKHAWNQNITYDNLNEERKSISPRESMHISRSLSMRGSLSRSPSPLEIKQK